ncbi:hypothetical protein EON81_27540, partial [bacterium]
MELGVSVSGSGYAMDLSTLDPIPAPGPLNAIIEKVAVTVSGPTPFEFGFAGEIALSEGRILKVATRFFGNMPTFLAASFQGEISMGIIIKELMGVDPLPDLIDPSLRDVAIYIVLNPLGAVVVDEVFPFGLGVKGESELLGYGAKLRIAVGFSGIVAEGSLNQPIVMGSVLEITGFDGKGAPFFKLDTTADPRAILSCQVRLLDLVQDVLAVGYSDHFELQLRQQVGPASLNLKAALTQDRFQSSGSAAFRVTATLGPLQSMPGGPSLGEIRIALGLNAHVDIDVQLAGPFALLLTASLVIVGIEVKMADLSLQVGSFTELPEAVARHLQKHANQFLKDLLQDADAWLKAVAAGLIQGVQDAERVLREHFQQTSRQIAEALSSTLRLGTDEVARRLKDIGD